MKDALVGMANAIRLSELTGDTELETVDKVGIAKAVHAAMTNARYETEGYLDESAAEAVHRQRNVVVFDSDVWYNLLGALTVHANIGPELFTIITTEKHDSATAVDSAAAAVGPDASGRGEEVSGEEEGRPCPSGSGNE